MAYIGSTQSTITTKAIEEGYRMQVHCYRQDSKTGVARYGSRNDKGNIQSKIEPNDINLPKLRIDTLFKECSQSHLIKDTK